uniref:Negative elongation factor A-like n=1 Tax=Phallusia mammillata TaxID=59560 RepID=A0A6F9DXI2_9ASCI|nr:negative elongation factor A-like [Phallusia mammillata]
MAHVRDSDTALWLHNKLGSSEELWIPSSIGGIIKTSTIDNIYRCFPVLTTTVKVKLLLGILHLPRRNLEEMQHMIDGIIEVALEDSDLWVQLVANMVRTCPKTFNLNLNLRPSPIAHNVVQQLSEKVKEADPYSSLPLECQLVNKTSLQSLVGNLPPVSRHFALKRKPKSAALRADLMHKSNEAVSHMKKGGAGGAVKSVPVKHRDMARRSSDVTPLKRTQSKGPPTRSDSYRGTSTPLVPGVNRSVSRVPARQQAGGTKLLDISEQPIGGSGIGVRDSKRRKKQLQQQESVTASQVQEDEEEPTHDKTPEYAAGLPSVMPSQSMEEDTEDASSQEASSSSTSQSLSHRRTTTESLDHDISSDSEAEPIEVTTPAKTLYFDNNKTTSSDSDFTSPQRLVTTTTPPSSREDKPTSQPKIPPPNLYSPPIQNGTPSNVHPKLHESPTKQQQQQHIQKQQQQQQQTPPSVNMYRPPQAVPVPQQHQPQQQPTHQQTLPVASQHQVRLTSPPGVRLEKQVPVSQQPNAPQLPTLPNHMQNTARMVVPSSYVMTSQRPPGTVIQSPQRLMISPQRSLQQQPQQPQQPQQQQPQQRPQQQQQSNPAVQRFYQPHLLQQQQQQRLPLRPQLPQIQQQQQQQAVFMKLPHQNQQAVQQQTPPQQPQQQQQQPQHLNPPAPKRGLTLTREQMFQAQEMFKSANRLSRPEKAIILGFMAGSRENPYPDQGDIVQIVLSEGVQSIASPTGGILPVIVETLYEMNYRTGQAGKRQRIKPATLQPGVPHATIQGRM